MAPAPPESMTGPTTPTMIDEELPNDVPDLGRGVAVGRYMILERVGAGGMGVVYAAWDPELDRKVALKLLHSSDVGTLRGSRGHARLLREAQALAKLAHANVVAVHDVGTWHGRVFVAMEFVEGRTLTQWLRARPHTWQEVLSVLVPAGRGLAAAHRQGLVHRDFKPDNVLVGDDDRPRVVDFGLARAAGTLPVFEGGPSPPEVEVSTSFDVPLTATGALAGTPAYMAPEQHNRLAPDERSDQFSFCVTLWEALYGARPFSGDSVMMLALNVCRGSITAPDPRIRVPPFVRRALERGLSPEPAERHTSIDALLAELSRPPADRRRSAVLLGGAAVVIGAAMWFASAGAPVDDPCGSGEEQVAAMWGPKQRDAIRARLSAVDAGFATAAWQTASSGLDDYAAGLAHAWRDACEATQVRHEQSDELFDRRVMCLQDRFDAFAATAEVLAQADREVAIKAAQMVSDLSAIDPCADVEWLMARLPPPADASERRAVEGLRRRLADTRALRAAGRYRDALAVVEGLGPEVDALAYEPLTVEVKLAEGELAWSAGRIDAAEAKLEDAAFDALAIGHDEILARASIRLASVMGVGRSRYEVGELWGRGAAAALRRLGEDHESVLDHATTMCMMWADAGAVERARPYCGRAYDFAREHWGPHHLRTASALRAKGNADFVAGDYEAAGIAYERAYDILLSIVGDDHPDIAMLLNSRAAVCHGRGGGADCIESFAAAREAVVRGFGPAHPMTADVTNNLAIVLTAEGRLDEAEVHARRALEIRRSLGTAHPGTGAALRTLGKIAAARGHDAEAADLLDQAVENLEATRGKPHPDVVEAWASRGQVRLRLGRVDEAITDLQAAVSDAQTLSRPAPEVAELKWELARALDQRPAERARARDLAIAARDALGPAAAQAAEIEAWLRDRSPATP